MGVPIKYAHAEVGGVSTENVFKEQHEVELALDDPVKAADNLVKAKWVIRNVAEGSTVIVGANSVVVRGIPSGSIAAGAPA